MLVRESVEVFNQSLDETFIRQLRSHNEAKTVVEKLACQMVDFVLDKKLKKILMQVLLINVLSVVLI